MPVDRRTLELVELRREITCNKTASSERPALNEVPKFTEVGTLEGGAHECAASKKRTLDQSNQLETKAKSAIKEALSAIKDRIRQINDRLGRTECRKKSGIRLQKSETYPNETVAPVMKEICPKKVSMEGRSLSNSQWNKISANNQDGTR